VAVFPAGEEFTPLWKKLAGARPCMTFGVPGGESTPAADIDLAGTEWQEGLWQVSVQTPAGPVAYRLHIAGRHNVRNSLAAVACALAAGVPLAKIAEGLEAFEPVKGRSRALAVHLGGRTITLVDDTYNANPESVRAAIDVLAELPGPRLLVLGDMGEVGDQGPQFHAEVGEHARQRAIERFFTIGDQSTAMRGHHFTSIDALNAGVLAELPHVASVLVKGSRFMKMERVIEAITAHSKQQEQDPKETGHAA
jgi:UDP-N-acetylmuramoyl-tripeptide--D-alanyl-D-alanine ligase